jgi:SAM-dependent methyltransferase
MSGFSADWLSLREPADHRARDKGLIAALSAWSAGRDSITVLDLGCGTGSNARAMIPHLHGQQHWRLVDYDRALLDVARGKLAEEGGDRLHAMTVKTEEADLSLGLTPLLAEPCDIVTASALFDLMSKDWLESMVTALAIRRLPFYTVLIYDGVMDWAPEHPLDEAVRDAFNTHQLGDKGFGPSAGPEAGVFLAWRLIDAGYEVTAAPSPWTLGREDRALMLANLEGVAQAAREMGHLPEADLAEWVAFRRDSESCTVGHLDLLAFPK